MGKGKPRHNPDKPQNKIGDRCTYYETYSFSSSVYCEGGCSADAETCKGNPHNCIKTFYKRAASRSDKQKLNGVFRRK